MTSNPSDKKPAAQGRPCPICGKPAMPATRPFCSPRCADVDLHHWLSGSYAVPAAPEEDDERVDEGPEN